MSADEPHPSPRRDVLFISKATPEDDEFVLWIAPRLEAAGYSVFADILSLEPGERWRKTLTNTLQDRAVKMLLCCRDVTLNKEGVQEEIGIGKDVVRATGDDKFIIPLRLASHRKLFGIGELQRIDFVGSWAKGLRELLEALERQGVPRSPTAAINASWEAYKNRLAIRVQSAPEVLTSNWVRIESFPPFIRYFQPSGAMDIDVLAKASMDAPFPVEPFQHGFFTFASAEEVNELFAHLGRFFVRAEIPMAEFLERGSGDARIHAKEAKRLLVLMLRRAWNGFCAAKGLRPYEYSSRQIGFHVTDETVPIGKFIAWSNGSRRRASMLCNTAAGRVWQYGVTVIPSLWPEPHLRFKARVLFSTLASQKAGDVFDKDKQHSLRRSVCKGWRNKAWHGRLMAFLQVLSLGKTTIEVPLARGVWFSLATRPIEVTAPVTTELPDALEEDVEEQDDSTLGAARLGDEQ
jgi:hypothetical protein